MSYMHAVHQVSTDISIDTHCFHALKDARKHRKTQVSCMWIHFLAMCMQRLNDEMVKDKERICSV